MSMWVAWCARCTTIVMRGLLGGDASAAKKPPSAVAAGDAGGNACVFGPRRTLTDTDGRRPFGLRSASLRRRDRTLKSGVVSSARGDGMPSSSRAMGGTAIFAGIACFEDVAGLRRGDRSGLPVSGLRRGDRSGRTWLAYGEETAAAFLSRNLADDTTRVHAAISNLLGLPLDELQRFV